MRYCFSGNKNILALCDVWCEYENPHMNIHLFRSLALSLCLSLSSRSLPLSNATKWEKKKRWREEYVACTRSIRSNSQSVGLVSYFLFFGAFLLSSNYHLLFNMGPYEIKTMGNRPWSWSSATYDWDCLAANQLVFRRHSTEMKIREKC